MPTDWGENDFMLAVHARAWPNSDRHATVSTDRRVRIGARWGVGEAHMAWTTKTHTGPPRLRIPPACEKRDSGTVTLAQYRAWEESKAVPNMYIGVAPMSER